MGLDEGLASERAGLCRDRIVDDRCHGARRRGDVRLGPDLPLVVRIFAGADRHQFIRHGIAGHAVEEIGVAGIVGADRGLPEQHGLGEAEAEAFRAMQRYEGVGRGDEAVHFRPAHGLLDEMNALVAPDGRFELLQRTGMRAGVEGLDDEADVRVPARAEGPMKRLDHGDGVLALNERARIE